MEWAVAPVGEAARHDEEAPRMIAIQTAQIEDQGGAE